MTEEQRKKLAYEAMERRMAQIPKASVPVSDAPKVVELPPVAEVPKTHVPSATVEVPVVQPVIEQPVQYFPPTNQSFDQSLQKNNPFMLISPN